MPRRAIVDPYFGSMLRNLRQAHGMSLRDLATSAYVGKSSLSDLENGTCGPSAEMAAHLDQVLGAGGKLRAMVTEIEGTGIEARERIAHVVARPMRLDGAAVAALAEVLAAERRLDDAIEARVLLPLAVPQSETVQQLAREARGPNVSALHRVAAEWTQFIGWLHAEARCDARAVQVLTEAAAQADAIGDGLLAAQAENFRGYLERQRGNPRGIVRHFMAAYATPGATILQRVGDAVQAAHGYALLGDRRTALRLLGEANDLTSRAGDEAAPAAAYWLSPTFSRMGIGLAYLALGDRTEAAQQLRAGLAGLPAAHAGAEWAAEYRDALTAAVR